jgi:chromosome partitioning protein
MACCVVLIFNWWNLSLRFADPLSSSRGYRLPTAALTGPRRTAIALGTAFLLNQCPPTMRSPRAIEGAEGLKMRGVLADPIMTSRADFHDAG